MVSIQWTRMRTQVSSTMSSWENNSDSRLAQLETRACSALMRQVFAHSNIPSLAIVGGILADAEVGAAPDDWFRMLRCQRWWWKWREGAALTLASQNPKRDLTLVPAIRSLVVLQRLHSWNWFLHPSRSDANSKDPHETVLAVKQIVFNLNHIDPPTQSCQVLIHTLLFVNGA